MNNRHDKLMSYIWVGIILSPLIVGLIVSIKIVDITITNDWIGFYGAIIGGVITYFGIYMSIKGIKSQITAQEAANNLTKIQLEYEKKKNEEERRLNIRPYINEFNGSTESIIKYLSVIFEKHELEGHVFEDNIVIRIKNIGLGPMISLRVTGLKAVNSEFYEQYNDEVKSLEKEGVMELKVSYMHSEKYLGTTYQVEIEYQDILDNLYSQTITLVAMKEDQKSNSITSVHINNISKQELITNEGVS